jgi:hypothetical protein
LRNRILITGAAGFESKSLSQSGKNELLLFDQQPLHRDNGQTLLIQTSQFGRFVRVDMINSSKLKTLEDGATLFCILPGILK